METQGQMSPSYISSQQSQQQPSNCRPSLGVEELRRTSGNGRACLSPAGTACSMSPSQVPNPTTSFPPERRKQKKSLRVRSQTPTTPQENQLVLTAKYSRLCHVDSQTFLPDVTSSHSFRIWVQGRLCRSQAFSIVRISTSSIVIYLLIDLFITVKIPTAVSFTSSSLMVTVINADTDLALWPWQPEKVMASGDSAASSCTYSKCVLQSFI